MDLLLNDNERAHYNLTLYAKAGVKTLADFILHAHPIKEIVLLKTEQIDHHKHNPVLRNAAETFLFSLSKNPSKKEVQKRSALVFSMIHKKTTGVVKHGAKKIKIGSTVFVHSMTSLLFETLQQAKKHKNFFVNSVNHAPLNYGSYLKKAIKTQTTNFNDLDIEDAVLSADLCLLGGTTILKNGGAVVKKGSRICSLIAKKHNTPVYVVAQAWNYHPKQETASGLFTTHKNTQIYETIAKEDITGYITEHGIIKPEHIIEELKRHEKLGKSN